jgi:hypothetical protein
MRSSRTGATRCEVEGVILDSPQVIACLGHQLTPVGNDCIGPYGYEYKCPRITTCVLRRRVAGFRQVRPDRTVGM